jgi:hypothetical protein
MAFEISITPLFDIIELVCIVPDFVQNGLEITNSWSEYDDVLSTMVLEKPSF